VALVLVSFFLDRGPSLGRFFSGLRLCCGNLGGSAKIGAEKRGVEDELCTAKGGGPPYRCFACPLPSESWRTQSLNECTRTPILHGQSASLEVRNERKSM
jgi:hypothetical protein